MYRILFVLCSGHSGSHSTHNKENVEPFKMNTDNINGTDDICFVYRVVGYLIGCNGLI